MNSRTTTNSIRSFWIGQISISAVVIRTKMLWIACRGRCRFCVDWDLFSENVFIRIDTKHALLNKLVFLSVPASANGNNVESLTHRRSKKRSVRMMMHTYDGSQTTRSQTQAHWSSSPFVDRKFLVSPVKTRIAAAETVSYERAFGLCGSKLD